MAVFAAVNIGGTSRLGVEEEPEQAKTVTKQIILVNTLLGVVGILVYWLAYNCAFRLTWIQWKWPPFIF